MASSVPQDERDRIQLERLTWLDLVHQPGWLLAGYAPTLRASVPARVIVAAAAARPAAQPDDMAGGLWQ